MQQYNAIWNSKLASLCPTKSTLQCRPINLKLSIFDKHTIICNPIQGLHSFFDKSKHLSKCTQKPQRMFNGRPFINFEGAISYSKHTTIGAADDSSQSSDDAFEATSHIMCFCRYTASTEQGLMIIFLYRQPKVINISLNIWSYISPTRCIINIQNKKHISHPLPAAYRISFLHMIHVKLWVPTT